jgi:glycogen synthase
MIKRILMTGDTVGGVWTYTMELAEALGAHGVEVVLAALGGAPTVEQRVEAARIPNLDLLASDFKLEWMDDPWHDVTASGNWLLDLEEQYAPDVVHLNSFGHGALPWNTPVVVTAHSCVLSWWSAVRGGPVPPQWNRYRYEVECAVKAADLVTTPSRAMLRMVEEIYGCDLPACRVVPNGRDASCYRAAAKEQFVLTAGRVWDEAKNIAAVGHIAAALPWPAYVAGENRHPNGTTFEFPGCRMLGRLSSDELGDWYARAPIYVSPARYEPFGLSALEAALSGCALVLGDIESLREVWEHAAIFVPPDDERRLEAAVTGLIANPEHRKEMSRRSAARAQAFTPERMAAEYASAYDWLAGTRRLACAS